MQLNMSSNLIVLPKLNKIMKKKHKLIMLATNVIKDSNWKGLVLNANYKNKPAFLQFGFNFTDDFYSTAQHLYILSDDELKKGDWVYDVITKKIYQITDKYTIDYSNLHFPKSWNKIIATTNSDLKVKYPEIREDSYLPLPQIPLNFIKHFISEYNAGRVITEVEVEYTEINVINGYLGEKKLKLKINQDNTINISIVEEKLYTRSEVEKQVWDFGCLLWENEYGTDPNICFTGLTEIFNGFLEGNL